MRSTSVKNMRAIEANVLVRLLVADQSEQSETAARWIAQGAWVSHLVLMETVWVLGSRYAYPLERLITFIDQILYNETLIIERPEVVEDALNLYRQAKKISFSDCLILAVARAAGHTPLGAFDQQLGRLEDAQALV